MPSLGTPAISDSTAVLHLNDCTSINRGTSVTTCFFHCRNGASARNCRPPCTWKTEIPPIEAPVSTRPPTNFFSSRCDVNTNRITVKKFAFTLRFTEDDSRMIFAHVIDSSAHCMHSARFIATTQESSSSSESLIRSRFLVNMQHCTWEVVTNAICHYHRRYGGDARNCQHPCRWGTERDSDDDLDDKFQKLL